MIHRAALFTLLLCVCQCLSAKDAPQPVNVGDAAPKFTVLNDQGEEWKAEDHYAKGIVVVYFYPADCTGGCTKQAQAYRDSEKALAELGVEVVGVSGDSVDNHKVFKKKESLNFTLLADGLGEVANAFGVPVKKEEKTFKTQFDGQEVELVRTATAQRWTFVIKDGKVVYKNDMVKAPEDCATVLETVKNLK